MRDYYRENNIKFLGSLEQELHLRRTGSTNLNPHFTLWSDENLIRAIETRKDMIRQDV